MTCVPLALITAASGATEAIPNIARGPCKPGSVLRAVSVNTDRPRRGSHSSRPRIAPWLKQPTRASRGETPLPFTARGPYLALLRVGFAMRALLPEPRCALTAPFHPCLRPLGAIGGILSVALSLTPDQIQGRRALPATLVSWSPDFPRTDKPLAAARTPWQARYSGRGEVCKAAPCPNKINRRYLHQARA